MAAGRSGEVPGVVTSLMRSAPNPVGWAMDSIAMIAARMCGRSLAGNPKPAPAARDETPGSKPPWRRAPRTKAARAIKTRAIRKTLDILDRSRLAYTQPLVGKFVIEPRPGVAGSKPITVWPARNRLRIGRRPTETHGLHAFQQALADQGHPVLGYCSRAKPPKSPRLSSAERMRARREANLAEMAQAYAERVEFIRQSLDPDKKIRMRDPRSARVKRLFRRAWARPI
jgi:hypothetical protein